MNGPIVSPVSPQIKAGKLELQLPAETTEMTDDHYKFLLGREKLRSDAYSAAATAAAQAYSAACQAAADAFKSTNHNASYQIALAYAADSYKTAMMSIGNTFKNSEH